MTWTVRSRPWPAGAWMRARSRPRRGVGSSPSTTRTATASSCRPPPMPDSSDVFAAVASPVRRALLGLLLDRGPLPVQQLATHFEMTRPSVSEHLKVLKDAGLVQEHKSGRHRYYQLEPQPLQQLSEWLTPYERFWPHKLASLRELLDTQGSRTC